ncbi:MAG TPA: hypothetical protein VFU88_12685, partial [Ktedonobacterales bacterium]|nr:hypothetical protein [Ktedonobacterales bacterium]
LRYLLNAFLADGESRVVGPALSDDTAVLVRALRALGARLTWEAVPESATGTSIWSLRVIGVGGQPRMPDGPLQMGNAGAVLRLLLGLGALLPEVRFETDHPASLGRRPNADLLAALAQLGIAVEARGADGLLPIVLRGGPLQGGAVRVSGARSSQYLSALLYLAPLLPRGLEIAVSDDLRSAPLVRATLRALADAGIAVDAAADLRAFTVPGVQSFAAREYAVPGDGPTAAALACAAFTLGRPLRLAPLDTAADDTSALLAALAFGAALSLDEATGTLTISPLLRRLLHAAPLQSSTSEAGNQRSAKLAGPPPRAPVGASDGRPGSSSRESRILDGDACIDSVPVLVAAACFVPGETRFERVGTLRFKESDRIGDLCTELARAGADVTPGAETIMVRGQPQGIAGGVRVDGHDDHRLVQALAIAALGSRAGLTITGADAVAKSYPGFFADLARLGALVTAPAS